MDDEAVLSGAGTSRLCASLSHTHNSLSLFPLSLSLSLSPAISLSLFFSLHSLSLSLYLSLSLSLSPSLLFSLPLPRIVLCKAADGRRCGPLRRQSVQVMSLPLNQARNLTAESALTDPPQDPSQHRYTGHDPPRENVCLLSITDQNRHAHRAFASVKASQDQDLKAPYRGTLLTSKRLS